MPKKIQKNRKGSNGRAASKKMNQDRDGDNTSGRVDGPPDKAEGDRD